MELLLSFWWFSGFRQITRKAGNMQTELFYVTM